MTPLSNPTSAPRIWHVGNWCAHWGNEFRQSAFRSSIKDFEVLNYARFLSDQSGTSDRSSMSDGTGLETAFFKATFL